VRDAVRGNVQAAREIADRTEGKAKQAIEFEDATLTKCCGSFAELARRISEVVLAKKHRWVAKPQSGKSLRQLIVSLAEVTGALLSCMDRSKTPIGPVESWSPTLQLFQWWGPIFCQIYNDASRPILGKSILNRWVNLPKTTKGGTAGRHQLINA